MNAAAGDGEAGREGRYCGNCGQPLGLGATFCRSCGARYEPPSPPAPSAPPGSGEEHPRRNRTAIWIGIVIVGLGAGGALAILLSGGKSSSSTTVVVESDGSTTTETISTEETTEKSTVASRRIAGSVEAGRYVQAGSFKTDTYSEAERDRLLAEGIDAEVVRANEVEEFYPGFRVLLVGPVEREAEEKAMIKALDRNGVSGFARPVSPAQEISASEVAGEWSGILERSSSERPRLNDSLIVTLEMDSDGNSGTLEVPATGCTQTVTLAQEGAATLTYRQGSPCVSGGPLRIRPAAGELMVTVLPLSNDTLVMGSLTP